MQERARAQLAPVQVPLAQAQVQVQVLVVVGLPLVAPQLAPAMAPILLAPRELARMARRCLASFPRRSRAVARTRRSP